MPNIKILELNEEELLSIENGLAEYDKEYITYKAEGKIHIGAFIDGELAGGVDACMTAFHIVYVSTFFIKEKFRRQRIGKTLILEMEKRAKNLGANTIRLDTFDWQGRDFYLEMGYEEVGSYTCEEDMFSEYFFRKEI